MATEHNVITDPEIHEPKNISTAIAGHTYHADGAGGGNWYHPVAYGSFYYTNIGTGITLTTPTTYTLINPATTAGTLDDITQNSLGRLTYTGTPDRLCRYLAAFSFKHSTGSGQDITFAVFKNGVEETGSNIIQSADSSNYQHGSIMWDTAMTTNDYLEVFVKVASGNVIVHTFRANITAGVK